MLPDRTKSSENLMSLPTDAMQVKVPQLVSSSNFCPSQLHVDQIMPGIYLTNSSEVWTPEKLRSHGFTHIINIDKHIQGYFSSRNDHNYNRTQNDLSQQFETLDLNFGEKSYLTTVLPNCYKAVKFIDKALQNGGAILVIDRNSNQKCLTIVTAYLMYKNNLNFNDAFQRIKKVFKKAELERYFISQLYEYEPILQVQKAQARGNSCSRELRSAFLKRKKLHDDSPVQIDYNYNYHLNHIHINNNYHDSGDVLME